MILTILRVIGTLIVGAGIGALGYASGNLAKSQAHYTKVIAVREAGLDPAYVDRIFGED